LEKDLYGFGAIIAGLDRLEQRRSVDTGPERRHSETQRHQ